MIAILDYRAGNLASVQKAFAALDADHVVTGDPVVAARADKLVLPGVGHFSATGTLRELGLADAIKRSIASGKPFLGICVGMQYLFEGSAEAPAMQGLGLFRGTCARFPENGLKVPHVGWNALRFRKGSRLFQGIEATEPFAYFTHSYYVPAGAETSATVEYGGPFCAAVERENVFGVQFHPEKSGDFGLRILRNFKELPC